MKYLFYISLLFIFVGCSSNSDSGKESVVKKRVKAGPHQARPQIPLVVNYDSIDGSVRNQVKSLDSIYGKTPYYTTLNNKKVFIVMKGNFNKSYYEEQFTGRFKYGIVDDSLKPILDCEYDKIYNPNLTLLNCMEIKKGTEVGLYNFVTNEILEPQFEFIAPSSKTPDNIAYGFKEGVWYKIENTKKILVSKTSFSPIDLLKTLSFDVKNVNENLLYCSYDESEGPESGNGVVVVPSYIEYFKIMPEICEDVIIPNQDKPEFGTQEMNINTGETKSITDKLISFVVSFYRKGLDARDYAEDSKNVIVYNTEKNVFFTQDLNKKYDSYDNFCHDEGYKFINDTIIEVLQSSQSYIGNTDSKGRYDFEDTYTYRMITKDGEIQALECNRYYNFTKYFVIDDSYFRGCYSRWMEDEDKERVDDYNVWVSEHLTIDDLDLMVNEIYAEYGLKFKTAKWQTYFSQFNWYKPQYDNVDKLLSKLDKKNIEIIAKEKAKMKGKENDYVNKHKDKYWAAG